MTDDVPNTSGPTITPAPARTRVPCRDIATEDTRHAIRWVSADGQASLDLCGPAGASIRHLLAQCGTFSERADILEGSLDLPSSITATVASIDQPRVIRTFIDDWTGCQVWELHDPTDDQRYTVDEEGDMDEETLAAIERYGRR